MVAVELEHLVNVRLRLALGLTQPCLEVGVSHSTQDAEHEEKLSYSELMNDVIGRQGHQESGKPQRDDDRREVGHKLSGVDDGDRAQR